MRSHSFFPGLVRGIQCIEMALALALHFCIHPAAPHRTRHSGLAHQVAGRHRELELLVDPLETAKHRLANAADGLAPAERLLDTFADDLVQSVTRVSGGATINRTAATAGVIAGDVWRDHALAARGNEIGSVVGFVGTDAAAPGVRCPVRRRAWPAPHVARRSHRHRSLRR